MTGWPYTPGRVDVTDGARRVPVTVTVDGDAHCLACHVTQHATDDAYACQHITHVRRLHADPGMVAVDTLLDCIRTDDVPDGLTFQAYTHRVCTEARQVADARDAAHHAREYIAAMTPDELEAEAVRLLDNRSTR